MRLALGFPLLLLAGAALGCARNDPSRALTAVSAMCPLPAGPVVEIAGEVAHPGRYPLVRDTTLRGALLAAGGVTRLASLQEVRVARCGQRVVVDLDAVGDGKASDPALRPGDRVEVQSRDD